VYLVSGSRPRYPTMVILLKDAMANSPLLIEIEYVGGAERPYLHFLPTALHL
jgi:hypothetical protein